MAHRITAICGDGIGQEVIPAAVQVLENLNLPLEIDYAEAGFGAFEKYGSALPETTLQQCENSDAILFGATQSPMTKVEGYQSPILALRKHFNLYANLRPAVFGNIDMLIVRENTEGLYSKREWLSEDAQTAIAERVITVEATRRIVQTACEQAMTRRKQLTIVHKANVLKETCGLFREVAFDLASNYPELTVNELLVDTCAMMMAMDSSRFDVIVTSNLFGDILSDLAAGLTGGPGLAPSANVGNGVPLFEPVHGSAPDIAGQGIADPRAAILSAALLLKTLAYIDEASQLERAVYRVITHNRSLQETLEQLMQELA
jgi:homoisocitrate dehydrogenase